MAGELKIEWKRQRSNYAYLGAYVVGSTYYNAMMGRNDPDADKKRYRAHVTLPGIEINVAFPTEQAAMEAVERAVAYWVKRAGL